MSTPVAVLQALAWGTPNTLTRACVDCGLITGNFCDSCLAADRVPSEKWEPNQATPLCTFCDDRFFSCHFCRGVQWAQPPPWGAGSPPRRTLPATAQGRSQCPGGSRGETASPRSLTARAPEPTLPPTGA